jgi:predicted dehydrogenase
MNIAVVGCGAWGRNYVRVLHEIRQDVVAVADKVPENLNFVRERYPSVRTTTDPGPLLADPSLKAMIIATPGATHTELVSAALRSGKHVLVEKPLALSAREGLQLVELARDRGLTLMVGHTFLYNNSVRKMKELAGAPETGRIYYLVARRNHAGSIREDLNVMWDLMPHDLSIFSYILEEKPAWVSAIGGSYLKNPRQDVVFLTVGYPSGALGNIQASWIDAGKVREVALVASRRRIVFDDLDPMEPVRVFERGVSAERAPDSFGEFQFLLRDGDVFSPRVNQHEPLKNQCQHFVECVEQRKRPLSDGQDGYDVVRVLEAADRSVREKGRAIELA